MEGDRVQGNGIFRKFLGRIPVQSRSRPTCQPTRPHTPAGAVLPRSEQKDCTLGDSFCNLDGLDDLERRAEKEEEDKKKKERKGRKHVEKNEASKGRKSEEKNKYHVSRRGSTERLKTRQEEEDEHILSTSLGASTLEALDAVDLSDSLTTSTTVVSPHHPRIRREDTSSTRLPQSSSGNINPNAECGQRRISFTDREVRRSRRLKHKIKDVETNSSSAGSLDGGRSARLYTGNSDKHTELLDDSSSEGGNCSSGKLIKKSLDSCKTQIPTVTHDSGNNAEKSTRFTESVDALSSVTESAGSQVVKDNINMAYKLSRVEEKLVLHKPERRLKTEEDMVLDKTRIHTRSNYNADAQNGPLTSNAKRKGSSSSHDKENLTNQNDRSAEQYIHLRTSPTPGNRPHQQQQNNPNRHSVTHNKSNLGARNMSNPEASNISNLGASNISNPGTSNISNPGTSNISNPGTSNISNPGTSNISNPGTSNISNPGTSNMSNPEASNMSNPEASNMNPIGRPFQTFPESVKLETRNKLAVDSKCKNPVDIKAKCKTPVDDIKSKRNVNNPDIEAVKDDQTQLRSNKLNFVRGHLSKSPIGTSKSVQGINLPHNTTQSPPTTSKSPHTTSNSPHTTNKSPHTTIKSPHTTANESRSFLSTQEKMELASWGLPDAVLERYHENGIRTMFSWQAECLSQPGVVEGRNLVYSAPTSAGKTLVAEVLLLKRVVEEGKKGLFILPFVSVAREKMYYLQKMFGAAGVRVEGFMGSQSPPGGLKNTDIAVCTIEKANNLVNRLLEENTNSSTSSNKRRGLGLLGGVGMVVVDELHLVGDQHRGYLLELLLTKLTFLTRSPQHPHDNDGVQIIGMSATLPNLPILACWLGNAALYTTTHRPVPLQEHSKLGTWLYDAHGSRVRQLQPQLAIQGDSEHVTQLCLETVLEGYSVLIFCPTKAWCESLSATVAKHFFNIGRTDSKYPVEIGERLRGTLDREGIGRVLDALRRCPVGLDTTLARTVAFGAAYHHAGLTLDERDIIEGGFRAGSVRVLVATSTLCSGVNLPARRVIIRSLSAGGGGALDPLTYKQMVGRAGRKGVDTEGESIIVCSSQSEAQRAQSLLAAQTLPPITSCLHTHNSLSASMKRAILEVIVSGLASTPEEVGHYCNCTLLAATIRAKGETKNENKSADHQNRSGSSDDDNNSRRQQCSLDSVTGCINFLLETEFIRKQEVGGSVRYSGTQLGLAVVGSGLSPDEGLRVFSELHRARQCFVLENELHILYQVTPTYLCSGWAKLDWAGFLEAWERLGEGGQRVGRLVGVDESFIVRAMKGAVNIKARHQVEQLAVHQRFYTALALQELVQEVSVGAVAARFGAARGALQALQQAAATFAGMVTGLCGRLGWDNLALLLAQYLPRLHHGARSDLCDLLRLPPPVDAPTARHLHTAGLSSVAAVARAGANVVEDVLHAATPFHSNKMEGNEGMSRQAGRPVLLVSGRPLTEAQAARLIVAEARQLVQKDLGLSNIDWSREPQDAPAVPPGLTTPGLLLSRKSPNSLGTVKVSEKSSVTLATGRGRKRLSPLAAAILRRKSKSPRYSLVPREKGQDDQLCDNSKPMECKMNQESEVSTSKQENAGSTDSSESPKLDTRAKVLPGSGQLSESHKSGEAQVKYDSEKKTNESLKPEKVKCSADSEAEVININASEITQVETLEPVLVTNNSCIHPVCKDDVKSRSNYDSHSEKENNAQENNRVSTTNVNNNSCMQEQIPVKDHNIIGSHQSVSTTQRVNRSKLKGKSEAAGLLFRRSRVIKTEEWNENKEESSVFIPESQDDKSDNVFSPKQRKGRTLRKQVRGAENFNVNIEEQKINLDEAGTYASMKKGSEEMSKLTAGTQSNDAACREIMANNTSTGKSERKMDSTQMLPSRSNKQIRLPEIIIEQVDEASGFEIDEVKEEKIDIITKGTFSASTPVIDTKTKSIGALTPHQTDSPSSSQTFKDVATSDNKAGSQLTEENMSDLFNESLGNITSNLEYSHGNISATSGATEGGAKIPTKNAVAGESKKDISSNKNSRHSYEFFSESQRENLLITMDLEDFHLEGSDNASFHQQFIQSKSLNADDEMSNEDEMHTEDGMNEKAIGRTDVSTGGNATFVIPCRDQQQKTRLKRKSSEDNKFFPQCKKPLHELSPSFEDDAQPYPDDLYEILTQNEQQAELHCMFSSDQNRSTKHKEDLSCELNSHKEKKSPICLDVLDDSHDSDESLYPACFENFDFGSDFSCEENSPTDNSWKCVSTEIVRRGSDGNFDGSYLRSVPEVLPDMSGELEGVGFLKGNVCEWEDDKYPQQEDTELKEPTVLKGQKKDLEEHPGLKEDLELKKEPREDDTISDSFLEHAFDSSLHQPSDCGTPIEALKNKFSDREEQKDHTECITEEASGHQNAFESPEKKRCTLTVQNSHSKPLIHVENRACDKVEEYMSPATRKTHSHDGINATKASELKESRHERKHQISDRVTPPGENVLQLKNGSNLQDKVLDVNEDISVISENNHLCTFSQLEITPRTEALLEGRLDPANSSPNVQRKPAKFESKFVDAGNKFDTPGNLSPFLKESQSLEALEKGRLSDDLFLSPMSSLPWGEKTEEKGSASDKIGRKNKERRNRDEASDDRETQLLKKMHTELYTSSRGISSQIEILSPETRKKCSKDFNQSEEELRKTTSASEKSRTAVTEQSTINLKNFTPELEKSHSTSISLLNTSSLCIIDVAGDAQVFFSFLREVKQQPVIALSLACQKATTQTGKKGGIGWRISHHGRSSRNSQGGGGDVAGVVVRGSDVLVVGMAVCWGQRDAYYLNLRTIQEEPLSVSMPTPPLAAGVSFQERLEAVKQLVGNERGRAVVRLWDAKTVVRMVAEAGLGCVAGAVEDPRVATWLLDPTSKEPNLHNLVVNYHPESLEVLDGIGAGRGLAGLGVDTTASGSPRVRSAAESVAVFHLAEALRAKLSQEGLLRPYVEIEMPSVVSMAYMELTGMGFNNKECQAQKTLLQNRVAALESEAFKLAGHSFPLSSPAHVSRVLYRHLHLPPPGPALNLPTARGSKTGTGQVCGPTNKGALVQLSALHPLPSLILEWRKITAALTKVVCPIQQARVHCRPLAMERIHPTAHTFTATGRITLHSPCLQSVPRDFTIQVDCAGSESRTMGHQRHFANTAIMDHLALSLGSGMTTEKTVSVRCSLVAGRGRVLLAADYCQLELRLLTHFSADPDLLHILGVGGQGRPDVFTAIAARLHHTHHSHVTPVQRQKAKQICYGILYGMGSRALGEELGVEEEDAQAFMERFHTLYPATHSYLKMAVDACRAAGGMVETLMGRRRHLPNINSDNQYLRAQCERQAVNTKIQGSAADLVKLACVEIEEELREAFPSASRYITHPATTTRGRPLRGAFLVLHLHDELIYEVCSEDVVQVSQVVRRHMEQVWPLKVPLPVKIQVGPSWGTLQPYTL